MPLPAAIAGALALGSRIARPIWNLASKGKYNPLRPEVAKVPGGFRSPNYVKGQRFPTPIPGRPAGFLNPQAHPGGLLVLEQAQHSPHLGCLGVEKMSKRHKQPLLALVYRGGNHPLV